MENDEALKNARGIIQVVLKARKNLRMYPSNNPVYANTLEESFRKFKNFFQIEDDLVFAIRLYDIYYGDEVVYHNHAKQDDNLALFFYKDGIRELTFKNKVPFEELSEFLKVVSADFEKEYSDDDLVTLFWEKDFSYIRYVVEDEFLTDEEYEEIAVDQAKKSKTNQEIVREIYNTAEGKPEKPEKSESVNVASLTDKDFDLLSKELEDDKQGKLEKFVKIIFEILYTSKTKEEVAGTADILMNTIEYAVRHGNFKIVIDAVSKLKLISSSSHINDTVKQFIGNILFYIQSQEIIDPIGEYLDSGKTEDAKLFIDLVKFFDKNAIPPLMKLLEKLESIHARKLVIEALVILGPNDFETLAKGLDSPQWYLVRNIIHILRRIENKKAVQYLMKMIQHPDVRVKKEAIISLGELGDSGILTKLKDSLDDEDAQIRITAVMALGNIGTEEVKYILLDRISDARFKLLEFNEKKVYFEALARFKDQEIYDFLLQILKKRPLIGTIRSYEARACAAYCLGLIGNVNALPYLSKNFNVTNRLLREYSKAAFKRIDDESRKRS